MADIIKFQNIPANVDERADNPKDIDSFIAWLSKYHSYDYRKYPNYYNIAVRELERNLKESMFWSGLRNFLIDVDAEYHEKMGNPLLETCEPPPLNIKSLNSVIEKAYRKDVLKNESFPEEPRKGGWILPNNWFASLHDILRTTIIVRYLDGVDFLLQRLKEYSEDKGCEFTFDYEARENGYYAVHTGTTVELQMPQYDDLSPININLSVEIQITTQLQSIIKDLLHTYYEKDRVSPNTVSNKWQWEYKSERFNTNYLGHMVHFIEGMVVELRDKQQKNSNNK